jgi:tetratricopeptide (TPR) repeat protein
MRVLVGVLGLSAAVVFAAAPWYVSYERGLEAFRKGDQETARAEFEEALASRPTEGLHVPTDGLHSVDYLPHLYLAIACYHLGDLEAASDQVAAARRSGVAAESPTGGPLLDHYEMLIRSGTPPPTRKNSKLKAAAPAVSAEEMAALRASDRQPAVLSKEELARVTRETLTRCGVPPDTGVDQAPWYFHFEMGLTMAKKGDFQRAVDFLIAAAERKPMPDQAARMYGMWFTDYRPYLEIASSHVHLGNWRCAVNALALSEKTGEVDRNGNDEASARYRSLLDEIEGYLDAESGGVNK